MEFTFDAYVSDIVFDGGRAAFALGDGRICWESGTEAAAHDGAVLCATRHPKGEGLLTGGDDGRLVWSRDGAADVVAERAGRWIDAVAASTESGLIAFASGRDLHVRDAGEPAFERVFNHERSVAAIAFDPKGRRIAAATYGGAALWYARIADQKPVMLRWAGSHVGLAFSPDGKFLVSAMQESALHGWRLSDARDMRMGGYPSKVRSLAFLERGLWLATAGANGVVLWPFSGANGPMGKQASEIGFEEGSLVTRVAGSAAGGALVAGLDNGRVWACDLTSEKTRTVREASGAPITALAFSDGRVAWGDEAGGAGVADLPL
jgi:WD40 repeat protein